MRKAILSEDAMHACFYQPKKTPDKITWVSTYVCELYYGNS